VHEQERRLRRFIGEMQRLADALVIRMSIIWHPRQGDPVLAAALHLRDELAAEARRVPLLERWQVTFDRLLEQHEVAEFADYLDRYLQQHDISEEPRLTFARRRDP
jgi:hypothetical protein